MGGLVFLLVIFVVVLCVIIEVMGLWYGGWVVCGLVDGVVLLQYWVSGDVFDMVVDYGFVVYWFEEVGYVYEVVVLLLILWFVCF